MEELSELSVKEWMDLIMAVCGTIAFAVSGAMVGVRKHMDIFGTVIMGITTAVGGGILRDLLIGNTPPVTFRDPMYLELSAVVALIVFIPAIRGWLNTSHPAYDLLMFWMDTIGLAAFTVSGIQTARLALSNPHPVLLVFVGVMTGVGGGILRDVMAGDTSDIFIKHIYGSASLAGGGLCVLFGQLFGEMAGLTAGLSSVILIRCLAAYFRWNLPRA